MTSSQRFDVATKKTCMFAVVNSEYIYCVLFILHRWFSCEPIMHQVTLVYLVLTFMSCTHPAACASSGPSDGNLPGPNNAVSIRCFHLVNQRTSSDWIAFPSLLLHLPPPRLFLLPAPHPGWICAHLKPASVFDPLNNVAIII